MADCEKMGTLHPFRYIINKIKLNFFGLYRQKNFPAVGATESYKSWTSSVGAGFKERELGNADKSGFRVRNAELKIKNI